MDQRGLGGWLLVVLSVVPFLTLEAVFFVKLKRRERDLAPPGPAGAQGPS